MKPSTAILIVAVLALVLWEGDRVVTRKEIGDKLWVAFDAAGYPGEWGIALGVTESDLNPRAVNMKGSDGKRGGAWGVTQITETTARAYGFTAPMQTLIDSPETAIALTIKILQAGRVQSLEDLGAWWNAGKRTFAQLPETKTITNDAGEVEVIPHPTRYTYVPRLLTKYQEIIS